MKSIMITGHRPNKLPGGYNLESPANKALEDVLYKLITASKPTSVITGMALGVDQLYFRAAIRAKKELPELKIIAAVPCRGQEKQWPEKAQNYYHTLLKQADVVKVIADSYTNTCMKERNQWMVKHCTGAIAVYDGSSGGTCHAVNALMTAKKPIVIIHPQTGVIKTVKGGK